MNKYVSFVWVVSFLFVFASCVAIPDGPEPDDLPNDDLDVQPHDPFSLRGDPNFDPLLLSDEARLWYDRVWMALENERTREYYEDRAGRDDLYTYGRSVNQFLSTLIQAFRVTGDLRMVDELDRYAQLMRAELYDGGWFRVREGIEYRIPRDMRFDILDASLSDNTLVVDGDLRPYFPSGTVRRFIVQTGPNHGFYSVRSLSYDSSSDRSTIEVRGRPGHDVQADAGGGFIADWEENGYLNWRWSRGNGQYTDGDYHVMDELMTHGLVAAIARVFHENRDLPSPGGVDYAERADFWLEYLKNHHEPKWRERNFKGPDEVDVLTRSLSHPFAQGIRYHVHLAAITGNPAHQDYALELIEILRGEQTAVETSIGTAYVWPHGVVGIGSGNDYLQGTTYMRYDIVSRVDLRLEDYLDDSHLRRVARTLIAFVFDGNPDGADRPYAGTIGGDQSVGGVPHRDGWRSRVTATRMATSGYAHLLPWDVAGGLEEEFLMLLESEDNPENPRHTAIPTGMLMRAILGPR